MSRRQIIVHIRNNPDFTLEDLIELETFLYDRDDLSGVDFDGHDYGADDSNIFIFSNEMEKTIAKIAMSIEARYPDLNFAIGSKAEGVEADYDLIASRGIYEIIMQ